MDRHIFKYLILLLLLLPIQGVSTGDNDTSPEETRQPRSSRRVVKLYSGQRPKPMLCEDEGLFADPHDCTIFHQCMSAGNGRFKSIRIRCAPGTIFDPDAQICNHPQMTRRTDCGGRSLSPSNIPFENEISKEIPTPISTKKPVLQYVSTTEHINNKRHNDMKINSLGEPLKSEYYPVQRNTGNECTQSGFLGYSDDCKKFYRCVEDGKGTFSRYEFTCSEGTVWDPQIQSCNNVWAVKGCGGKHPESEGSLTTSAHTIFTPQSTISHLEPVTRLTTTTRSYSDSTIDQIEDENDIPYGSQSTKPVTNKPILTSTVATEHLSDEKCQTSGFMGDKTDCKKFYRCVDNNNGGYTRYDFTCGPGTVWDSKIQSCNHEWAVEKCGENADINKEETTPAKEIEATSPATTQTQQNFTSTVITSTTSTLRPVTSQVPTTSKTTTALSQTTQNTDFSSLNMCKLSGFIGDDRDCKKFYRCVDNGDGSFTKYEFYCGEGTVWDPKIQTCNHAGEVDKCGSQSTEISYLSSSTTPVMNDDENQIGYPNQNDEIVNKPETSTASTTYSTAIITTTTSSSANNKCTRSGFLGDKKDCKKFYRCVEDGQGGYTRYEFTCGEGTAWDQTIETCNFEWAVKGCQESESGNAILFQSTESAHSSAETEPLDQGYNQPTTQSTTTQRVSSTSAEADRNQCTQEGFYGDNNDCKKFFRCVDNGQGKFIKYDFTCGEGTVWDQDIQACDHETSNKRCGTYGSTTKAPHYENDEMPVQTTIKEMDSSTTASAVIAQTTEQLTTSQKPESSTTQKPEQTSIAAGNDRCNEEGFFANRNDCKKFYRCVDNGKGGFTKYEFTCGEGTIWVQEIQACDHDNDISGCSSGIQTSTSQTGEQTQSQATQSSTTSSTTYASETHEPVNENDKLPSSSSKPSTSEHCTEEGFYPNKYDCTRFYRCVSNGQGGYTKYEFTCGEGTAWDTEIQNCNHKSHVMSCKSPSEENSQPKPIMNDEDTSSSGTTESTGSESLKPSPDKCEQEGYYGNTKDCKKFYRCVDDGNGGLTKYDFDCGEGTIWDQDLLTCNHPQDVVNPSCKNSAESAHTDSSTSSSISSSTSVSQSQSTAASSNTTDKDSNGSDCSQESSSKKPDSQKVKCEKEGFYADPDDCKKFYRCVDWDGNGERFSVYHFECGEGTIWDPQLVTCNHEDSVYPPRDCSGTQQSASTTTENTTSQESTTNQTTAQQITTTQQYNSSEQTTTQQTTTSEQTTTQQTTTSEQTTTQSSNTSEQTTTQQSTTSQPTTTQQSTTSEQITTQQSTTSEKTTIQPPTTSEQTTTQQSTTSEQTTTQQSATSEQTTTQQSTTSEKTTTQQSTTSEPTTTQQSTTSEQTITQESTTSEQTTTQSTTTSEEPTTASNESQSTTDQASITSEETESTIQSTTESTSQLTTTTEKDDSSTTEDSTSEKECPETERDQYLYVCPTSFRRHPKYCNMFYQCTEDDDNHDIKFATFTCPNNTIYDESKVQCVDEDKADKKCDGQKVMKYRTKRRSSYLKEPMEVGQTKFVCSHIGNYPFESNECSSVFLKCQSTKSGKFRGYVNRCPEGYMYWSISKKCEKKDVMRYCNKSPKDWSKRWEIPMANKRDIAK